MNLQLSEQQEMLKAQARDFLATECPKKLVRDMEDDDIGHPVELWREMAELGWQGLIFPEEYGGSAGTFVDLAVIFEEMGRACLPGPFFPTVILGGFPILDLGTEEQKQKFLPQIARGDMIMTLAFSELNARNDASDINVRAVPDKDDYIINGVKLFVPYAHVSDWIICVARTKDELISEDGITLFLVDSKSQGLSCHVLLTMAHDKQCELTFNNVMVSKSNILGEIDKGWDGFANICQRATVAKCLEMVGGAQQVLDMTVDYSKSRVQFGRPIGSFQSIQHYCANMAVDVAGARFIAYQAAWLLSEGLPCTKEIAMAKAWVNEAYKRIIMLGHEIHAAIGFTWDHDMQLYSRRATVSRAAFGDTSFHRERVAQLM